MLAFLVGMHEQPCSDADADARQMSCNKATLPSQYAGIVADQRLAMLELHV